jgi:hypothetical protein
MMRNKEKKNTQTTNYESKVWEFSTEELSTEKNLIMRMKKIPLIKHRLELNKKLTKEDIEKRLNIYCKRSIENVFKVVGQAYRGVGFNSEDKLIGYINDLKKGAEPGRIAKLLSLNVLFFTASIGEAKLFATGYGVVIIVDIRKVNYKHVYNLEAEYSFEDILFDRKSFVKRYRHVHDLSEMSYGGPITYLEVRSNSVAPDAIKAVLVYKNFNFIKRFEEIPTAMEVRKALNN